MTPQDLVLTPRGVRFHGRLFPCTIGKGGLTTQKREGDGATPVGHHRIVDVLYRADRLARPVVWARPIGPMDLWSDDSRDSRYNSPVRAPYGYSHERLRRSDPLYDIVLVTNWNHPQATAGRGSAIFLHQWRRPGFPTEGCIAFSRSDLAWITARLLPGTGLIVPPLAPMTRG